MSTSESVEQQLQALSTQLDIDFTPLIKQAIKQLDYAYVPYSKYPVGCSLLTADNTIIAGSNIENAAFGPGLCAERTALYSAVSRGHLIFKACIVATRDGGSCCGACRQALREFFPPDETSPIIFVTSEGVVKSIFTIKELLPEGFGPENLGVQPRLWPSPPPQ